MRPTVPAGNPDQWKEELETLFRNANRTLYRVAYHITGNAADADEVVQTVFLRLLQGDPPKEFNQNPMGYLRTAVRNESQSAIRSRNRRNETHEALDSIEIAAPSPDSGRDDRTGRLREALAQMDPEYAEVLNLYYVEEICCAKIAQMLGKTIRAVWLDLYRARKQVKQLMRIEEKESETPKKNRQRDRQPRSTPSFEAGSGGSWEPRVGTD